MLPPLPPPTFPPPRTSLLLYRLPQGVTPGPHDTQGISAALERLCAVPTCEPAAHPAMPSHDFALVWGKGVGHPTHMAGLRST